MPHPGHACGPLGVGGAPAADGAATETLGGAGEGGASGAVRGCWPAPHAGQNFAIVGMNVRHRVQGSSTAR